MSSLALGMGIGIVGIIFLFFVLALAFAVPIMILIYVFKLDNPKCGCIKDWRNTFIKFWTIAAIAMAYAVTLTKNRYLAVILAVMNAVNVYALFTYVGDLNAQNCKCATENLEFINDFLYYWRFLMVVSVSIGIISALFLLFNPKAVLPGSTRIYKYAD